MIWRNFILKRIEPIKDVVEEVQWKKPLISLLKREVAEVIALRIECL
jgi:hypothetical protein